MTNKLLDISEEQMRNSIIIAGGGISGLYAAKKLAEQRRQVILIEGSSRFGGRIETEDMDGFTAEFGPMRFEPKLQPRFDKLVKDLDIEYVDFTGPSSEISEFPKYNLSKEEEGYTSLELLKRGVLRIMGQNGDPRHPSEQAWIDDLSENDYDKYRETATLGNQFLWEMGFWNALTYDNILSHQALMKIRDTGTFYHMIPDNLNAIEWTIWWLRALKSDGEKLTSLEGGSSQLTKKLLEELEKNEYVTLKLNTRLLDFKPIPLSDKLILSTWVNNKGEKKYLFSSRLILALPQAPLKILSASLPVEITKLLDTVNGFPMVKVFFVTKKPFWRSNTAPQTQASEMPTREVHYFYRKSDGHGMALIYTDRPATEYWNLYVQKPDEHHLAEIDKNEELKNQFSRFLANELKQTLNNSKSTKSGLQLTADAENTFKNLSEKECAKSIADSVITYGIRDWGRAPYGAANHSWRPNVKSKKVQASLKAFALEDRKFKNVHICGEAFSDYSGFIEGALNSAHLVLDAIEKDH